MGPLALGSLTLAWTGRGASTGAIEMTLPAPELKGGWIVTQGLCFSEGVKWKDQIALRSIGGPDPNTFCLVDIRKSGAGTDTLERDDFNDAGNLEIGCVWATTPK